MRARTTWLLLPLAGCFVKTDPPPGTELRCGAGRTCPAGMRCDAHNICRPPSSFNFLGVRVTPYQPAPSDTLLAWPVGLSNPDEETLELSVRWRDDRGRTLAQGPSPTLLAPDGGFAEGTVVRAEVRLRNARGAEILASSCARSVAARPPGWFADRPSRPTRPEPGEPPPQAVMDEAQHRLIVVGERTWELDLERARTVPGLPPPPAAESRRWRSLSPSGSSPLPSLVAMDQRGKRLVALGMTAALLTVDRGCEAWTAISPAGTPPRSLALASVASDPTRDRILVYGGLGTAGALGDLVALRLDPAGGEAWEQVTTTGSPPPRYGHVGVIDTARGGLLVAGGFTCGSPCGRQTHVDDVWLLALGDTSATWRQITTTGNAPLIYRSAATYDPVRKRLLVWGGCTSHACASYRSELNALVASEREDTWRRIEPSGTPPSTGPATAFYDATDDALLILVQPSSGSPRLFSLAFGGTLAWEEIDPHPAPRSYQASTLVTGGMAIYGGVEFDTRLQNKYADDRVWLWDGVHWNPLSTTGVTPGPRAFHGFVPDGLGGAYLHGGERNVSERLGDLWQLVATGNPAWTRLDLAGAPAARAGHAPASLPASAGAASQGPVLRFIGGYGDTLLADGFDLVRGPSGLGWSAHAGTKPPARSLAATTYDPGSDRVILIGGQDSAERSDLWSSPLAGTVTWTQEAVSPALPTLAFHAATSIGPGRIVVYGGLSREGLILLLCRDAARTPPWRWKEITFPNAPERPCGAEVPSALFDPAGDVLILYGGGFDRHCDPVWRFAPASRLSCPP